MKVNLDGLRPFDQCELLDCNGHGPSGLCVKWTLEVGRRRMLSRFNREKKADGNLSSGPFRAP